MIKLKVRGKKYLTLALLFLASSVSLVSFQNCGQPIQSQTLSTASGTNTASSTAPNPSPTPGLPLPTPLPTPLPSPGPIVIPPATAAERQTLCAPYVSASAKASITVSPAVVDLTSGYGNGSGDTANNLLPVLTSTINPAITNQLGSQMVPAPGRNPSTIACSFVTSVTCAVATDAAHPITITKAINMDPSSATYGENDAANPALLAKVAGAVVPRNNTTCAPAINPILAGTTTPNIKFTIQRNASGYRCVSGSMWVKLSVRTQVEASALTAVTTADADSTFIKINFTDGCYTETRLKTPADLPRLSAMGTRLAVTDQWIAAVAPLDNDNSLIGAGSVYMFRNVNGNFTYFSKITIPDASANDNMSAAAIVGNKLVISTQKRNVYSGAAFMYNFNGASWVQQQVLSPPNAQNNQLFGSSLSMTDTALVIGAPGYSVAGQVANDLSGAAYVYSCTATVCNYRYVITGPAGSAFGTAVSLYGNRLAVGAPQALQLGDRGEGIAQVWDISGAAVRVQNIDYNAVAAEENPVDLGADSSGMRFGTSIALYGNQLAIGAPSRNVAGTPLKANTGRVYYYSDYTVASPVAKKISNNVAGSFFGKAVAFNSKGLYVGCPQCSGLNAEQGLVNFYANGNLITAAPAPFYILFGLDSGVTNNFGSALFATDNYLGVGAATKTENGINYSGGAYVYKLP